MDTAFPITLHLSVAIGVYMVAGGVGGLLAPQRWRALIDELERSSALIFVAGIVVFAIGAVMVMSHNYWLDPLGILVTVIGWAAAIEGVLMLALPGPLIAIGRAFMGAIRPFAAFTIILGIFLIFAGLTGEPTTYLV